MADTIQLVQWSLHQICGLRDRITLGDPVRAMNSVAKAAIYAQFMDESSSKYGIFDDVCVTSYTSASLPGQTRGFADCPPYPASGFVLSDAFKDVGGAAGLIAMCAYCPANTSSPRPAGCCGTFYRSPADPKTQERLLRILARLGLGRDHAAAFAPTTLIWYGLWARSPLSADALRVIGPLMRGMLEEEAVENADDNAGKESRVREIAQFIRAVEAAAQHRLALHVSMSPPGHTDLGYYTVFAHCPFCKAWVDDLPRWKRKLPKAEYTCKVCGTRFSPAQTASSTRDDWDRGRLRDAMGPQRFAAFAKAYLIRNGVEPGLAEHIVTTTEADEELRLRQKQAAEARKRREWKYVKEVLFNGLHPVYLRDDVYHRDGETPLDDPTDARLQDGSVSPHFTAAEFAELLRRCEVSRIKIVVMSHRSKDGEHDKTEWRKLDNAASRFAKWRRAGFADWFRASFAVPDSLLPPENQL